MVKSVVKIACLRMGLFLLEVAYFVFIHKSALNLNLKGSELYLFRRSLFSAHIEARARLGLVVSFGTRKHVWQPCVGPNA